ncbi:hypothetical protein A3C57_00635 [Candidatus Nomurabacteria bacterium RIFCSPHIGHO2_02_FULL_33_12]|uniref:Alpha/beta hydrolase n=1 Tax=Candidatus Nomurabacteria bacterium RIFCSPLOWO2_01_FULL_33_17 TaxID=1801764 RepID=A0A1F6WQF4_9BACT|nr:MAG: hypothetical protein A3C57_00635 [Candidatus Nomurabacteria bacterium RIFCSPHIGHO2_02_FULL_33_12]OGI84080.1 MAG: hypothetical protein A2903_02365 [Candidatus Nomurabacteria bacterium RIFCSPLOWO2_01_FULL_33_17]
MKIKIIFIPGNGGGDTNEGFFPYVKDNFRDKYEIISPGVYPDSLLARAKYWLPYLEKLGADENTILIGHSSGAIAAMRYAENHKILGSVLVAGYHTDLGMIEEKLSGYFKKDWNWENIKNNQKFIIQFNSTNDSFIPIEEARFVYEKLGSDYHELNQGHFYPQTEFPELVEALNKYIK